MKTKSLRTLAAVIVILTILFCTAMSVSALERQAAAQYTNPETSYQVMIIDELNLLSESEKTKLVEDMSPLTKYGHAVFWTTEDYTSNEIEQARVKRRELYQLDSAAIFAVNMNVRKLTIQSYGDIYSYVTDSKARSITNNVSRYATSKDYYSCAKEAFSQMYRVLEGEHISEPMKYISYAVISAMLGVIIAVCVAFSKRHNPLRREFKRSEVMKAGSAVVGPLNAYEQRREKIYVSTSSGGGSGCGGGSNCGGGSSCGGGGCGGGGSSSF